MVRVRSLAIFWVINAGLYLVMLKLIDLQKKKYSRKSNNLIGANPRSDLDFLNYQKSGKRENILRLSKLWSTKLSIFHVSQESRTSIRITAFLSFCMVFSLMNSWILEMMPLKSINMFLCWLYIIMSCCRDPKADGPSN